MTDYTSKTVGMSNLLVSEVKSESVEEGRIGVTSDANFCRVSTYRYENRSRYGVVHSIPLDIRTSITA